MQELRNAAMFRQVRVSKDREPPATLIRSPVVGSGQLERRLSPLVRRSMIPVPRALLGLGGIGAVVPYSAPNPRRSTSTGATGGRSSDHARGSLMYIPTLRSHLDVRRAMMVVGDARGVLAHARGRAAAAASAARRTRRATHARATGRMRRARVTRAPLRVRLARRTPDCRPSEARLARGTEHGRQRERVRRARAEVNPSSLSPV